MALPTARYTFDPDSGVYRTAKGRAVPWARVRQALDRVVDVQVDAASELTRQYIDGSIRLREWRRDMGRLIAETHTMAFLVAKGGHQVWTREDRQVLRDRIRAQLDFLDNFRAEMAKSRRDKQDAWVGRAASYLRGGSQTFEAGHRDMADTLYHEERRTLHSDHPCSECLEYARLGWVPVGTLPAAGADCECLSNCRCAFEYRRVRSG